jgi:single-strand DNA-binding protein
MNKCELTGNLTKDPELKTTTSGLSVCNFTIAVSRRFKNQNGEREADFIPVVAWKQTAEFVAKYLRKGNRAGVVGSIQTRSYDAQDGTRRYVTEVIADEVESLTPKDQPRAEDDPGYVPPAEPRRAAQSAKPTAPPADEIDEDLPF